MKISGRLAHCGGRSYYENNGGPCSDENPGISKILVERDSLPPKGQGFLGNVNQPRVSRS